LVRQRFAPSAAILAYHRVVDLDSDPQLLAVSPAHFAEHLEVLRRKMTPLRLAGVQGWLERSRAPARGVVITFDDGYADNLVNAKRILEAFDMRATVFITAAHIGCEEEFWWDELERLLLQPGFHPQPLRITLDGQRLEWRLDGAAKYDLEAYTQHRTWHVERADDPTPRHKIYRTVYQQLHDASAEQRRRALEQLRNWAQESASGRPSHRTLSLDELVRLSTDKSVEIGSHTLTHPMLSALHPSIQAAEIRDSKAWLESMLGQPVAGFAYPYGARTAETVALVREAGYAYACSTQPDVLWGREPQLDLPRLVVRDWDGEDFARFLRYWLGV
jgi:peptidoglycan/xylan/chitin deacetylase (PgdA/CDA1 family)